MDYTPIETKNYRKPKKSKKPLVAGIACFVAGTIFGATVTAAFGNSVSAGVDMVVTTDNHINSNLHSHEHILNGEYYIIKAPNCTNDGIARIYCDICESDVKVDMPSTGHTEVILEGYPATSKENGLTDGSYCEVCGEILHEQEVIYANENSQDQMYQYNILSDDTCEIIGVHYYVDDMIVPTYIDGYRVVGIIDEAFFGRGIKTIVIPDGVTYIGAHAFDGCWELYSVDMPNSVISIGYKAFNNCTSLVNITLPSGLHSIGNEAFRDCTSLEIVKIGPELDNIGESAFANCSSLVEIGYYAGTRIDWSNINKAGGWDYGTGDYVVYCTDGEIYKSESENSNLFGYEVIDGACCRIVEYHGSETEIVIPEYIDGYLVTAIGNNVFSSRDITSVVIPDSVKTIGVGAFNGCDKLKSVSLGEGLENIESDAFAYCIAITEIQFPNSLRTIKESAFMGCNGLTSVTIPGGVDEISYTSFSSCIGLIEVVLEEGVKIIGERAFENCERLIKVTLPATLSRIESYAFVSCQYMKKINYSDTIASWRNVGKAIDWDEYTGEYSVYCTNGTAEKVYLNFEYNALGKDSCEITNYIGKSNDVVIPEYIDGYRVTAIANGTFLGNINISSVELPSTLERIGENAFSGCYNLTKVYFNNTYSLTAIEAGAFNKCLSLEEITLPEYVKSIGAGAFRDCYSLRNVKVEGVLESIGENAFADCSLLEKIEYNSGTALQWVSFFKGEDWNSNTGNYTVYCTDGNVAKDGTIIQDKPSSQTDFSYTAYGSVCTITGYSGKDAYVVIPEYIDGYRVTEIGEKVFYNCDFIKGVTIPEEVLVIYNNAFEGCRSLVSVTMPLSMASIGANAFLNCEKLESISISKNTMVIGNNAFEGCYSLERVIISGVLNAIGERAFKDCRALTHIDFGGTVYDWEYVNKFDYWDNGTGDYTVYCTDGIVTKTV